MKEKEKKNPCTSMRTLQTCDRQLLIEFIVTKFFKRTTRRGYNNGMSRFKVARKLACYRFYAPITIYFWSTRRSVRFAQLVEGRANGRPRTRVMS